MTVYSAESFFRAKISQSITESAAVPITVRLSKLPTLTNGLLTISPNTEYEEIVEYNNPQAGTMTVDIIKRGIKPDSILLTTNGVDYNNTTYYKAHTQNDIIRGDVNHIHINQGIGNSTLATNTGVGITKLSVAANDPGDPIAVGTNDPRVGDASTTQKATVKLSVAPVSASNPIAVGDNDTRLTPILATNLVNGVAKLSVAADSAGTPIVVGDNDPRLSFASTTVAGRTEIATTAEINAGTTTGGTGAPLVVSPNELKTKTDSVVAIAATALANDYRTVTTNSTTAATSGAIAYSSTTTFPRFGSVIFYVTSSSGTNNAGVGLVQTSPVGAGVWTDSTISAGVVNGTSTTVVTPIPGNVDVRIKCTAPTGGGTQTATVEATYYL